MRVLNRVSTVPLLITIAIVISLATSSCATRQSSTRIAEPEKDRALAELKRAVEERIASAERVRLEEESRIRVSAPYFYKRFDLYPAGTGEPEFTIKETGSSLKPYETTVIVKKARFTTKYHASRSACARDKEFMRDIGTETDTYVYENGTWSLLYSVFETESTSVLKGDTWQQVPGVVERIAKGESESVFGNVANFFRGIF